MCAVQLQNGLRIIMTFSHLLSPSCELWWICLLLWSIFFFTFDLMPNIDKVIDIWTFINNYFKYISYLNHWNLQFLEIFEVEIFYLSLQFSIQEWWEKNFWYFFQIFDQPKLSYYNLQVHNDHRSFLSYFAPLQYLNSKFYLKKYKYWNIWCQSFF